METVTSWRNASIVGVIVAIAIFVGAFVFGTDGFFPSYVSNFLATVGGFALTLPIAVWLTLREAREQNQAEETHANQRRREVLEALQTELTENLDTLIDRRSRPHGVPFLQVQVWRAMSDGGELHWIGDATLLRQVARAFMYCETHVNLERRFLEVLPLPSYGSGPTHADGIDTTLRQLDPIIEREIRAGIDAIAAALARSNPDERDSFVADDRLGEEDRTAPAPS